ncbi:MAG: YicC family protein [Candidatus Omnitrophica bacterium]|nr:YicC family protein [Candidatus Omnitrophota bacterium]
MIRSMTGFGDARATKTGKSYSIEIRTLNQRFFDLQVRLPSELHALEAEIKKVLQTEIVRGKVTVFVGLDPSTSNGEELSVDEDRAKFYVSSIKKLSKKLKIKDEVTARDLLSFSDIFKVEKKEADLHKTWAAMKPVVEKALKALIDSREKEGKMILADLESRLKSIVKNVERIQVRAKDLPMKYKQKLERQVKELAGGLTLDEEKLMKEMAIMAERTDITEEIVRLMNHIELFHKSLREKGDVGKRLDFVIQEMNRETNTIGSKCADFGVASEVVEIKSELEKIREQIQNVE